MLERITESPAAAGFVNDAGSSAQPSVKEGEQHEQDMDASESP
jgi:hypothetical protein